MKIRLEVLAEETFDVVIIGGGIYGACVAWDAALRGLKVALIEKADFASATSANSLKIIHGGFRYLQSCDIKRLRASALERHRLMRMAPHLVQPICLLVPMFRQRLTHTAPVMRLALRINDILTFDRNRIEDSSKHIPPGRWIPQEDLPGMLPEWPLDGAVGAALFYDAQVHDTERLVISFIKSAADSGAEVANYLRASKILLRGERVSAVEAIDQLSGEMVTIHARAVVNASGPWANEIVKLGGENHRGFPIRLALALNVVTRTSFSNVAVGLWGPGGRFLFAAPWRGRAVMGTTYKFYNGDPNACRPVPADVEGLLNAFNSACPPLRPAMKDVCFVHAGLLPCEGIDPATGEVRLTQRPAIHDHRIDGLPGLFSVVGVKYTMARKVAEETVDRVFRYLGYHPPQSRSASARLRGGDIERFDRFLVEEAARMSPQLDATEARSLLLTYGSDYPHVLAYLPRAQAAGHKLDRMDLLRAKTLHAVREEMARTVADVIFRRTGLGSAGHPGDDMLKSCADVMSKELGWGPERASKEIHAVEERCSMGCVA